MNLIGPKSIAAKLHWVVKWVFYLAIMRVLLMAIAPLFPYNSPPLHHVSFDVQSGPLYFDIGLFQGDKARWWIWAMELVSRTCHAVVLYLLMRILEPAGGGEPFHPKTPNRLRMIGCAVIIGSILRTLFCAALQSRGMFPAHLSWQIDTDAIFIGLVLIVLGEVFRRGYVLRTESELTV